MEEKEITKKEFEEFCEKWGCEFFEIEGSISSYEIEIEGEFVSVVERKDGSFYMRIDS